MANLNEVRELHDAGGTVLEISNVTGVKRPLIYYWLGKWKKDPNINRRPTLTDSQIGAIVRYYHAGHTQAWIGRELEIPKHQVRYACRSMRGPE